MDSHQDNLRRGKVISTPVVGPSLSSTLRALDRNTSGSSTQLTPTSGGEDGRGRGRGRGRGHGCGRG